MAERMDLPEGQKSFKLNEVCKLANVQPYMLRYWGTEFPQLEARKSGTGQHLYSRRQVELILEIRRLLFDEGLTIAGARKRIKSEDWNDVQPPAATDRPKAKAKPKPEPKGLEPVEHQPSVAAAAAAPAQEEVDKAAAERVQPLLAVLQDARSEIAEILAAIEREAEAKVGT